MSLKKNYIKNYLPSPLAIYKYVSELIKKNGPV